MRAMVSTLPIMALIARAPWREAVTYRETWPHEYVVIRRDGQQALLAALCARIARGEGVECRFFREDAALSLPRRPQVLDDDRLRRHRPLRGRLRPQPRAALP